MDVTYTDFSKAFDTVNHNTLIRILDKLGLGYPLLTWFQLFLSNIFQFVNLFQNKSENIKVKAGVPQDGHLSPLLFNIIINSISKIVSPCRILLFADDAKIVYKMNSQADCVTLQNALFKLTDWCDTIGLSLNIKKCKAMSFFRSRNMASFDDVNHNERLPRVEQVDDLGFDLVQ